MQHLALSALLFKYFECNAVTWFIYNTQEIYKRERAKPISASKQCSLSRQSEYKGEIHWWEYPKRNAVFDSSFHKCKLPWFVCDIKGVIYSSFSCYISGKESQTCHHHKLWSVSHLLSVLRRKTRSRKSQEWRLTSMLNC